MMSIIDIHCLNTTIHNDLLNKLTDNMINRMVLRHLQAEWEAENIEDWSEDGLDEILNQFQVKV
jgi:hypothetical protein